MAQISFSSHEISAATTTKSEASQPVPKRTKTISGGEPRHFQGPLFPVMRRNATLPPPQRPADLRVSVAAEEAPIAMSDRDWVYPSFLVPHAPKRVSSDARRADKSSSTAASEAKPDEAQAKKKVKSATGRASISSASTSIRVAASRIWKPKFLVCQLANLRSVLRCLFELLLQSSFAKLMILFPCIAAYMHLYSICNICIIFASKSCKT